MKTFIVVVGLLSLLYVNVARSDGECGSAAEREAATKWFEQMKVSWEHLNAPTVTSMFAKDAEYREDPFEPPLRGDGQIRPILG